MSSTGGLLAILSNLAFFAPATLAIILGHYTMAAVYICIPFTSGSYHACDSFGTGCLFGFSFHRSLDFFFAQLIIPMAALYLIYWGRWAPVKRFLLVGFALALILLQYQAEPISFTEDNDLVVQAIVTGIAVLIVVIYWIAYAVTGCYQAGKPVFAFPHYEWRYMLLFVSLTALSIVMFVLQNYNYPDYQYLHSLWHCLAAFGQFYLLFVMPGSRDLAVPLDAKINKQL